MAFAMTTVVGQPALAADNTAPNLRADRSAALVVAETGGRYGEACRNGEIFTGSSPAAGVAVPLFSATTQQFVLQNPAGSNVAFKLRKLFINYVSGTDVAGHFVLAVATLPTSAITGTNSTTFITNNKLNGTAPGAGNFAGSKALLYTAATVVAFTYFRGLGQNQTVQTAATANVPWQSMEDFDESIIMLPGSAIAVAANVAAFVTAAIAIDWREVPLALVQ